VPPVRNIFTLGSCAPIAGADVRSFEDECDVLQAWRDFVVESDPDILTGYNIVGFDIPYLVDRAR
jgi:DNA polymerase delta subunit 1